MNDDIAGRAKRLKRLAAAIGASPRLQRIAAGHSAVDADELATEAADGLLDIVTSAACIGDNLLPQLSRLAPADVEFEDVLDDIAEELRHISYHVRNMKLFGYVNDM